MGPSLPLAEISSVELSTAIDKLRKGKAPGHDDLTADMIKALDAYGELKLLNLLNLCLHEQATGSKRMEDGCCRFFL